MDLFEAMEKRHSYRGPFRKQSVPREDLRKIVKAAILAPSGINLQTTQFVIVDDPNLVQTIGAMHLTTTSMQQAQVFIACLVDTDPPASMGTHSFQVEDCAAAVENMLLAITALGYASVWIDGWLRNKGRAEKIGQMLGIPPTKTIRVILPIGVPEEQHKQPEKWPFEKRAWFNRYKEDRKSC